MEIIICCKLLSVVSGPSTLHFHLLVFTVRTEVLTVQQRKTDYYEKKYFTADMRCNIFGLQNVCYLHTVS